jgi:1,2-dihydroxy-3-keto-5-methylthiopentene dioxygenase
MSLLTVHPESRPQQAERFTDFEEISAQLQAIGVRFERWKADRELPADADQETVIAAYRDSIDRLMRMYGFQSADVISVTADHPDKAALRSKFLSEHVHGDFEARFFVDGQALFYLHPNDKVYVVLCEKGDLISVPARTRHWFDMGQYPNIKAIRLFTTPDGWVAEFTGSEIGASFPKLEEYLEEYA